LGNDQEACCDTSCGGFTCPLNYVLKAAAAQLTGKDTKTCCDQKVCSTFSCPADYLPKANVATLDGSDAETCCDASCNTFECTSPYQRSPDAANIAGQDKDVCCAPPGPKKTCIVYGDPHCNTFDGKHNDYYTSGEFWIIKSSRVKIQGKYMPTRITRGLSVTKEVSVGGPFLQGHILMVSATSAKWDGQEMLTTFPATFKDSDNLIEVTYNDHGKILQPHRELGKHLKVMHITLPEGVFLQINQWTNPEEGFFINVMVEMASLPDLDGHCGNFNGNADDDDRLAIRSRLGPNGVEQEDLIGFKTKTPIVKAFEGLPTISECPSAYLIAAHGECQASEGHFIPSMKCLVHKCDEKQTANPIGV